jgi:hypothetical protein
MEFWQGTRTNRRCFRRADLDCAVAKIVAERNLATLSLAFRDN